MPWPLAACCWRAAGSAPRSAASAFGGFGSIAAGGGAVGLGLRGLVTQYFSLRWRLYVNLVFAALAVAGALAYIHSTRPAARPRMDWPGAVLACAGLFLIVFGFSHAGSASGQCAAPAPPGDPGPSPLSCMRGHGV